MLWAIAKAPRFPLYLSCAELVSVSHYVASMFSNKSFKTNLSLSTKKDAASIAIAGFRTRLKL